MFYKNYLKLRQVKGNWCILIPFVFPLFLQLLVFRAPATQYLSLVKTLASCKVNIVFNTLTFLHGLSRPKLLDQNYLFRRLKRQKRSSIELAGCACALDGDVFHIIYSLVNNNCFGYRRCLVFPCLTNYAMQRYSRDAYLSLKASRFMKPANG